MHASIFKLVVLTTVMFSLAVLIESGARGSAVYDDDAEGLFKDNCAVCHRADGKGAVKLPNLPDLTDPAFHESRTDEEITESISKGKGLMVAFEGELTEPEIKALVEYVRSLNPNSKKKKAGSDSERHDGAWALSR